MRRARKVALRVSFVVALNKPDFFERQADFSHQTNFCSHFKMAIYLLALIGPSGPEAVLGRSKNAVHILCDHKRRYQSRRCLDDFHPGEEVYTPSGDEAKVTQLYYI